jgi:hypothetical protein
MHRGGIAQSAKDELEGSDRCIAQGAKGELEGSQSWLRRVQLDGWFVVHVGIFLSKVNWVEVFFQARCMLARPCFLPLGFRGDAAAPM